VSVVAELSKCSLYVLIYLVQGGQFMLRFSGL
jgi:hypothetical protein